MFWSRVDNRTGPCRPVGVAHRSSSSGDSLHRTPRSSQRFRPSGLAACRSRRQRAPSGLSISAGTATWLQSLDLPTEPNPTRVHIRDRDRRIRCVVHPVQYAVPTGEARSLHGLASLAARE